MGLFSRGHDRQDRNLAAGGAEQAFERGRQEFAAGRFDAAARYFAVAVTVTPDSPKTQFLLGASLFNAGDSKAAIDPLSQCIAMLPEHAEAHFALGMALGRVDKLDEGLEHIAKAASLGDEKAREMMPRLGADYCRKCAKPADFGSVKTDADVIIVGPRIGMICADCHIVLCGPCARRDQRLDCPDCGGSLQVLTR